MRTGKTEGRLERLIEDVEQLEAHADEAIRVLGAMLDDAIWVIDQELAKLDSPPPFFPGRAASEEMTWTW